MFWKGYYKFLCFFCIRTQLYHHHQSNCPIGLLMKRRRSQLHRHQFLSSPIREHQLAQNGVRIIENNNCEDIM